MRCGAVGVAYVDGSWRSFEFCLVHLVLSLFLARMSQHKCLTSQIRSPKRARKQKPSEGVVEHAELQSMSSNPNTRRQLGDPMEVAP